MLLGSIKVLAVMTSIAMNLSPMEDIRGFKKANSTGEKHPLPYTMIAVNAGIWCFYGVVKGDYFPLLFTNLIGVVAGVHHLYMYAKHSNRKYDVRPFVLMAVVMEAMALSIAATYPASEAAAWLGVYGCTVVVMLYGAPLVTMRDVIKSQNSKALSRPLSALGFICSLVWTMYGTLIGDGYIYYPNGLGVFFTTAQLSLIVIFPDDGDLGKTSKKKSMKSHAGDDSISSDTGGDYEEEEEDGGQGAGRFAADDDEEGKMGQGVPSSLEMVDLLHDTQGHGWAVSI
mmetsp:Transcript_32321/g.63155  ORF Transcript_32321/g.63155 Transcript_32321/m.63155 type:complete len:285 (-) Transcript_32321:73-927(-)